MKNLYKSYALNLASLVALISIIYYCKEYIIMLNGISEGLGIAFAVIFLPRSLIYICVVLLSLFLEGLFYLLQLNFAFNFPYEKIQYKTIYYILFYFGLIWGLHPILLMLISSCFG